MRCHPRGSPRRGEACLALRSAKPTGCGRHECRPYFSEDDFMYDLSIVLPTCNRAALLERAIAAIAANTRCQYELIVVDGASTDHTPAVLDDASCSLGDRLKIIREPRREGFVRAANQGFRAASGRYMTWLNDDARPLAGALDHAVEQLESLGYDSDVAFVAMF